MNLRNSEQFLPDIVIQPGGFITMREPWIAGILSLLDPGVGQIYNGRILIGIIWLLLTGVSWIGSAGLLGWVVHLISAWCAYSYARDNPIR
jgi:TM2 domain-containing membrane protein YozV